MSKEPISQDKFDKMLVWLDQNRDVAGQKYEHIRRSLIRIFSWNHCSTAEDLADEVVDVVVRRIDWLVEFYEGVPDLYFYGVGRTLLKVHFRDSSLRSPLPEDVVDESGQGQVERSELFDRYLRECMRELKSDDAQLIVGYYQGDKREKIDNRKGLAAGLAPNTVRVKVHRIRKALEKCIERHLKQDSVGMY
jgi:DNA-directed RNA polymerase specialized sigma24 family protein